MSRSLNEREAYIALNMMEDIGPVSVRALVAGLGSASAVFDAARDDIAGVAGLGRAQAQKIISQRDGIRVDDEIKRAGKLGAHLLTPADDDYPAALRHIHDPPLALYVHGRTRPGDKRALAIVGSRRATRYGRETAELFAWQLAKAGFTIVSGLACGIDTAAHKGAIKGAGRNIAVLGGALDHLYPPENRGLAEDIAENGAVLSEFPLGRRPDRTTFPMRNRIISGLSMGVVVVEAGKTSGALITAGQALEQGRSVFAVPGRIDSPSFAGSHRLIKEGARLVEGVEDVLGEFEYLIPPGMPAKRVSPSATLSDEENIVMRTLEDGEMDVDALIRATGLKASAMCSILLGLEMKRMIRMLPGRIVEAARHE